MKAAATMRDEELARELLADRDRQAARADEAEAKLARVLCVMEELEATRAEDCARQGRFAEGGEDRLRTALGLLRVAIRPPAALPDRPYQFAPRAGGAHEQLRGNSVSVVSVPPPELLTVAEGDEGPPPGILPAPRG